MLGRGGNRWMLGPTKWGFNEGERGDERRERKEESVPP